MKKSGILNGELSKTIASMGHGDYLVISDAGLPVPKGVKLIDVSISKDIPGFVEVLNSVLLELRVEKVIIANELKTYNRKIYDSLKKIIEKIEFEEISHVEFKERSTIAKAIVRTGEFSPYSNIILISGVGF